MDYKEKEQYQNQYCKTVDEIIIKYNIGDINGKNRNRVSKQKNTNRLSNKRRKNNK
jgi:hypothetical protein